MLSPRWCARCEWQHGIRRSPIDGAWVCGTDHQFEWRTGRTRTEDEIVRHGRRVAAQMEGVAK